MVRIPPVAKEKADSQTQSLFELIAKKLGKIPNIFQTMGNSPIVLESFLKLSESAEKTSLSPKLREQIALAVGQANQCQYCLSAHSLIGKSAGLSAEEILLSRKAESHDAKTKVILSFVKQVIDKRAHISNQDLSMLKNVGISDKEVIEILFVIFVNIFTNYFNHIADPAIDFPEVPENIA